MRTLQVIYLEGKQRLQKAGNESPAFDAICLFEHVFHMNRQDLMPVSYTHLDVYKRQQSAYV